MPQFFRTLRFRVAAAFLLWTGLFQVAIVLLIPALREPYVLAQTDELLALQADFAATRLAEQLAEDLVLSPDSPGRLDPALQSGGQFFVQVLDEHGHVVAATQNLQAHPTPLPAAGPTASRFSSVPMPESLARLDPESGKRPRLRTTSIRRDLPGAAPVEVRVAMSLVMRDQLRSVMIRLLAIAGAAGILGAAIAGWIVANVVVSRLRRISSAVQAVNPTRLDERIDLPVGPDEVGVMAAEVNAMLGRLSVVFRAQDRFMAEVSHELKTPISALLAEAQVLKSGRGEPDAYRKFVLSVEDELRRLTKTIESFLMLARFEHGAAYLAQGEVPINDVADEAVEHSSMLAQQHGVQLRLSLYDSEQDGGQPDGIVRGDAAVLRIALDNLIRNAIRFSDPGSEVRVCVGHADGNMVVEVFDRGPGIPPGRIEHVFDRFAEVPGSRRGKGGTGLGLAIAKGVVGLHNGTIEARNHEGGGCVFTIRLPTVR